MAGCLDASETGQNEPPQASPENPPDLVAPDSPSTPASSNVDPWQRIIEWQSCTQFTIASEGDRDYRQSQLPNGFTAGGVVSELAFRAYECEALVVDNQTVLPSTKVALLATPVVVPEAVTREQARHGYLFAMWSLDAALVEAFRGVGFERSYLASAFDVDRSATGFNLNLEVDGHVVVTTTGPPSATDHMGVEFTSYARFFFGDTSFQWADLEYSYHGQKEPALRPVVINYHADWLQEIAGPPGETTIGTLSETRTPMITQTFDRFG